MNTKIISMIILFSLSVVLTGGSLLAEQTDIMTVNKKGVIEFPFSTEVGGQQLKEGHYKLFCEHTDTGHHLVFVRLTEEHPYYPGRFQRGTSDIVKSECVMEPLGSPASRTEVHTKTTVAGGQQIHHVMIKGETVVHVFE